MVISPGRVLHGNAVSPAAVTNTHTHTNHIHHTHPHTLPPRDSGATTTYMCACSSGCAWLPDVVTAAWSEGCLLIFFPPSASLQQSSESFLSAFLLIPLTERSVLCSNTNLSLKLQQTVTCRRRLLEEFKPTNPSG